MRYIDMNGASGKELYKVCRPYMDFTESGMDFGDFMELTCIPVDLLDKYFKGQRPILDIHLKEIADICGWNTELLEEVLSDACAKEREEKASEVTCRKQCERERRGAQMEEIMCELREYGIEKIYADTKGYSPSDYHAIKFILRYLEGEAYLPKLEALLTACPDGDLVHGNTNALLWAGEGRLPYEKLLLLGERKAFIAAHIHARGPQGMTALHHVANGYDDSCSAKAIRLLAAWGADVNAQDNSLKTPLHYAAYHYENERLRWRALLNCGADDTIKDKYGRTAGDISEEIAYHRDAAAEW